MGKTLILQMDELAQGMVQAFQVVNDAFAALEEAQNMPFVIDATVPADLIMTVLELVRYQVFRVQNATGVETLVIPSEVDDITPVESNRVIHVRNEGLYDLTVETDNPGNSVVIPPGATRSLLISFEDVWPLTAGGDPPIPFTLPFYVLLTPGNAEVLFRYNFAEDITFDANFAGSYGSLGVSPTSNTLETGQIVFSAVADIDDTVTIYDGINTTVFTFKASGNGATGAAVEVARGVSATDSGNNLRTAINNNTNIDVTAAGATTTVDLTNNIPIHGAITKSDADNDYAVTDFSGLDVFTMDVQLNGVSVGTIGVDPTDVFYFASDANAEVVAVAGDYLEVIGPATADGTAAEIAVNLKGARP